MKTININGVSKTFGDVRSLSFVTSEIKQGSIYGMIGSNGSGKSTLLRIMSGIFSPDTGEVLYGGEPVWENNIIKNQIVYISDEAYFHPHSTIEDMSSFLSRIYTDYDKALCSKLCDDFSLDARRKINTFSKGMQKQASVILALSCRPTYLLCDETFDGLDPVMRQLVKGLIAADVAERGLTPVIASHNLRELEDICDHIGLLHKGGILFERDIDDLKLNIHKIQAVFGGQSGEEILSGIDVVTCNKRGSLYTIVARGSEKELTERLNRLNPTFLELIPLSLEEIFISEMEDRGYDFSKIVL